MRTEPRRSGRALPLVAAGLLVGLAACAAPERGALGPVTTVLRFIEDEPSASFADRDFRRVEPAFAWQLEPGVPVWPRARAAELRLGGRVVQPRWRRDRVVLVLPEPVNAAEVNSLQVRLRSLTPRVNYTGTVALYWTPPGEAFDGDQMLLSNEGEAVVPHSRVHRFSLAGEVGWQGRLRLRFDLLPPGADEVDGVALTAISGGLERINTEAVGTYHDRGFKARLGGQTRNALPALQGRAHRRRLLLPEGAELRLACGLQPGAAAPVTFRVLVQRDGGSERLVGEQELGDGDRDRWHDLDFDLGALAGSEAVLVLEVAGEMAPEHGLALWANPVVVAPHVG
jgi:hypothetical protein